MKKFLKVFLTSFVALILSLAPASISYAGSWPSGPSTESDSIFIMDAYSSNVLFEKASDVKRYPASTTKILTCLLALENSSMDEMVEFSSRAVNLEEGAVTIDSVEGEIMRMEDLLYGLMLPSGNDCAVAIAEHIGGSVEGFAKMMNDRAKAIGATHSHFVNPNGLYDDDHYTTAHDIALIAQEAFKNSVFVKIISTPQYTAAPTNMTSSERVFKNINMLIQPDSEYYDARVIGGKTGFLYESGRCLVTFSVQDNMTVITVQLGGDLKEIFAETTVLLDYIFKTFSIKSVAQFENRFAFASSKSKVVLDPSAQILMLNSVPLSDMDSTITFAKDMNEAQIEAALASSSSINSKDAKLFAVINYAIDGHDLGSVNVYTDSSLKIAKASFINVKYINVVFIIIFVVIILVLMASLVASKKRAAARRNSRNATSRPGSTSANLRPSSSSRRRK